MPSRKRLLSIRAAVEARKQPCPDPGIAVVGTISPQELTAGVEVDPETDGVVGTISPQELTAGVEADPETAYLPLDTVEASTSSSAVQSFADLAQQIGLSLDVTTISTFVSSEHVSLQHSSSFTIHNSTCSWRQYYPVVTFLVNGHLHPEYERLRAWLGFPACSGTQWHRIVERLEGYVTKLAEWSCGRVREEIVKRGDDKRWTASYDGFYLTRGHYSNNASATLHDYYSGYIAWFAHRTKKGPHHNWKGTSAGAEGDMFDELLGKVKTAGFVVSEVITDKDSSVNSIFCRHFPEGMITYCSNHCTKTLHKDLLKIKQNKCECRAANFRCRRMTDAFVGSCKTALSNLVSSDTIQESEDALTSFSEALLNFHPHYCLDDHSSSWCHHDKVTEDGSPYKGQHTFTCTAQVDGFKQLFEHMASYPQDYVSGRGRLTTNAVEGFHGLALLYRNKKTDLGHTHYTCKTNMSICHKNIGPVWRVFCMIDMGVDVPLHAVEAILKEQLEWDRNRERTSKKDHLHKRNLQKKAKRVRHEQEKSFMETLRGMGTAVGVYMGGCQGEESTTEALTSIDVEADEPGLDDQSQNDEEVSSDDAHPLLIFYDCETTGFSIYNYHITYVGAKVVASSVPLETPTFSSLVNTSRRIPVAVTKVTGISTTMLRGERPLSVVLPHFLDWVTSTTTHVSNVTGTRHYPVLVAHSGFAFDFPVMLAEVERRQGALCTSVFEASSIHFSDTLPLLRQMKKDGHSTLSGTKLGMEALHSKVIGTPIQNAHRALPDVLAMESAITHPSLVDCLTDLPVRSAKTQLNLWTTQERFLRSSALVKALGKPCITKAQAKRLDKLGIRLDSLKTLQAQSSTAEVFKDSLREKGVNSKPLREKLAMLLPITPR